MNCYLSPELKGKEVGEFLARLDDSAVFSLFCTKVYGRDLGQMNRMDMLQLDRLLIQLQLTKNDHVLDLGCGLGKITEHISDITQAKITGIDFATEAIIRAQNRTKTKINRLSYIEADINDLSFPSKYFSCVIAIDSLYGDFIDDLDNVICKLVKFLKPHGQMGIFHTEFSLNVNDLQPHMTSVALALINQNLDFKTWDFTENEKQLLQKKISIAEELESKFMSANQHIHYEKILKHSEKLLLRIKNGKSRRFFYHVNL